MGAKKQLDAEALNAIMGQSEVKETGASSTETQQQDEPIYARRVRKRVEYRNFSINLELKDYNKFQQYLIDNDVRSGSALVRKLLKEKGII
ncbi:TPA: hypothetical protein RPW15_001506 [Campylobacter fetus subsp. venerealis]|nr:hypothetical protein [Campylobacter fetus subsp. venerealis]HDX6283699.1 hypothetical protein [Campylobacter fetus subsp. venerealis]HDX6285840.1 hypothetical protein [Campylobacter fetus subsp. venerealis]HDX6287804.1 hypothetical protein [Campylobacter fetus subsp. venerealis]HDX6289598.1 hypothetical protein [Campylobacter fetus subsp. venerealis]